MIFESVLAGRWGRPTTFCRYNLFLVRAYLLTYETNFRYWRIVDNVLEFFPLQSFLNMDLYTILNQFHLWTSSTFSLCNVHLVHNENTLIPISKILLEYHKHIIKSEFRLIRIEIICNGFDWNTFYRVQCQHQVINRQSIILPYTVTTYLNLVLIIFLFLSSNLEEWLTQSAMMGVDANNHNSQDKIQQNFHVYKWQFSLNHCTYFFSYLSFITISVWYWYYSSKMYTNTKYPMFHY